MYFPTAVILAAFPFLAGAVPVKDSLREFISIPLSKRWTFHNADGLVDIAGIQASTHHTMTFVLPVLYTEKGWILNKGVYVGNFEAFK
jgi:hypothetical protein